MGIKIYISAHCEPCQEIKSLADRGELGEDVQVIDVETDEGFVEFTQEVLSHGDGVVPSAYEDGQRCLLGRNEEGDFIVECPRDDPPSSPEE